MTLVGATLQGKDQVSSNWIGWQDHITGHNCAVEMKSDRSIEVVSFSRSGRTLHMPAHKMILLLFRRVQFLTGQVESMDTTIKGVQ